MTWDALRGRPWAWVVEIAGLSERYYSTHAPGSSLHSGLVQAGGAISYTDVQAVVSVGARNAVLDDVGGVARQDPVEVRLLGVDAYTSAGARVQPYETLMRTTPRGAETHTRLLTTLTHSLAAATVEVTDDVSGWTTPGILHIGQEAIYYTGTAGVGTVLNPYRFTGGQRAAARTQVQGHPVDTTRGVQEYVTADPTAWRGRRARIYVAEIYPDNSIGTWSEYWRGLLDSAPSMSGDTVTIRIAPMTVALNWQVGQGATAARTRVVPGWHALTRGVASELRADVTFERERLFRSTVIAANALTPSVTVDGYARLMELFDPTLPDTDPRHGTFACSTIANADESDAEACVSITNPVGDTAEIAFPTATIPTAVVAALAGGGGASIYTPRHAESLPLTLIDEDVGTMVMAPWPVTLLNAVQFPEAWRAARGSVDAWYQADGAGGQARWTRLGLLESPPGRWQLRARKTVETPGPADLRFDFSRPEFCRVGFGWREPAQLEIMRADAGPAGAVYTGQVMQISADPSDDDSTLEIIGPPVWWYQPGEPKIGPFEDNIYLGGGAATTLRITGAGTSVDIPVTGSAAAVDPVDGVTSLGYVYTVDDDARDRLQAIAMLVDDPTFEAELVARAERVSAPEFVLRLLLSGEGRGTNGTYDAMPLGLNFAEAEIDAASFTAIGVPDALADQSWEIDPGKSASEQMRGIMVASGCQVAQVFDGSSWVLRCVPLTAALPTDATVTIADDDCAAPIETIQDGRVVRSYEIRVNHPAPGQDGEPQTVRWTDVAARNASGGDSGESLSLDLRGVRIDGTPGDLIMQLLPVITSIRARLGIERVRWRARLHIGHLDALGLGLGDTVLLTSSYARDLRPTVAVSSRPCRVMGVRVDPRSDIIDVELVAHHGSAAGYVPAMRVDTVTDVNTVEVLAAAYSDDDASFFTAGDKVSCIPLGNWAGRAAKTVTSVTGTTVVITAHGLSAGDLIRLDDYDTAGAARAAVKGYAYIGDAAETLGGANDPAKMIA